MYCGAFSFVIFVWIIFTGLCGAWVKPLQDLFDDRAIAASRSVHEALVKAAIIPDGEYIPHGSIAKAFALEQSTSTSAWRVDRDHFPYYLITILDDFQPSIYVSLSYASAHKVVDLGNKIKPKKVTSPPVFSINASPLAPTRTSRSNTTYTLVLSDPDATSRAEPVMAQMCHWVVTNLTLPFQSSNLDEAFDLLPSFLPVKASKKNIVREIIPYLPPTPPAETGYHRYVFVLLASETEEGIERELTKPKDRPHWGYGRVGAGVREWADENGLVVVGANFFYSKNKKQ